MMPVVQPVPDGVERPFWSVMIPTFNSADLLVETLESVLAQDPGQDVMQIEVVDDASCLDDPRHVVETIGRGRVGFFRQEENVGAPANFTTCARRANGRFVHILHSDDVVLPGFYERYRQQIERCPDAVLLAGQTITIDSEGRHLGMTGPVRAPDGYVSDAAFVIATQNPLRCVSVVVARSAYERFGGFHPDLAHANDWEMWTRLASGGAVAWVDRPFGLYRDHAGSDTQRLHRSTGYIDDCLRACAVMSGYFEDPGVARRVQKASRRVVGDYANGVGLTLTHDGWFRLGATNALRAALIDPSAHTLSRAAEVVCVATARRFGPTVARLLRAVGQGSSQRLEV